MKKKTSQDIEHTLGQIRQIITALQNMIDCLTASMDKTILIPGLEIKGENRMPLDVISDEKTVPFARRDAEGKLTCVRCGNHWRPTVPYPEKCPKCGDKWDEIGPRGKYKRKSKIGKSNRE